MESKQQHPFDPTKYIRQLSGKDYLEVKWRLVWLRDVAPGAVIKTQMVEHQYGEFAVFHAVVSATIGEEEAHAEGWGSESKGDFRDYLEKAETKAVGRALAALGFGTQFCDDFDDGAGKDRPVDAPVDRGRQVGTGGAYQTQAGGNNQGSGRWAATPNQINFAKSIRDQLNLWEAYPEGSIEQMDGPAIRRFIDEYKGQLRPRGN